MVAVASFAACAAAMRALTGSRSGPKVFIRAAVSEAPMKAGSKATRTRTALRMMELHHGKPEYTCTCSRSH